jgi:mannitol 2-dehydrogenase
MEGTCFMHTLTGGELPDLDGVAIPTYDRSAVTVGIVHFGVGGFHRAHQAMYLDALMNEGAALDWGICGVGVLPGDRRMQRALTEQGGLYTLVLKQPDGSLEPRVIGSIVEHLHAPDSPTAVIEKIAAPTTRIVSLTITEGGYVIDRVTGEFDTTDPGVRADLAPGARPQTVLGLVTEALALRKARGLPGLAVMSCDNIQGNGDVAARTFSAFAQLKDPELAAWIAAEVTFPNSMVDRITPATSNTDIDRLAGEFGLTDAWPVVCEPFTQWVLEDDFSTGRPPLEQVGVQLVDDCTPHELMKLRLLNTSHQALGYLGYLAGHRYVHEVAADPLFARFLRAYMDREGTPTLPAVPGVDLEEYKTTLIERFANPAVADTLTRITFASSDRIALLVLPVLRGQLARGGEIELATAIVAGWARYAEGIDEQGYPIEVQDRFADTLVPLARSQRHAPEAFIRNTEIFGDLADDPRFRDTYLRTLDSLHRRGARATVEQVLSGR